MNKLTDKKKRDYIIELILGAIVSFVGAIVFLSKISGTRYGSTIDGLEAQVIGGILIFYGLYKVVSALKKFFLNKKALK